MIIGNTGIIKVSNSYLKQYEGLGFLNLKQGDIINLPIEHCSKSGTALIDVKCDYCHKEKQTRYCDYTHSINKFPYKYCCSYKCNALKHKEIMINKYGFDNYTKHPDFDKKQKETNLKRFGVDSYTKTSEYKEKYTATCQERYGNNSYTSTPKFKEKFERTCLERYGVSNPSQHIGIFNKTQLTRLTIKNYNDKIRYQGSYEKDFLDNYYHKEIIENCFPVKYINTETKIYFPDFYLPKYNLIVEIKSDYFYNKHLKTNLLKEKACKDQGYNFIFIINKNYIGFEELLKTLNPI